MQDGDRWEFIYNRINGLNESDVCEWVKDESSMEGALGPLLEEVYQARDRLCERLSADPEFDEDIKLLMDGFENFSRTCGRLMYHYGYEDGKSTK